MKKLLLTVLSLAFLGFMFGDTVHAAQPSQAAPPLTNGYYHIKPKLNPQLEVNEHLKLSQPMIDYHLFEFFYIPTKQGYVINDQFGIERVTWSENTGSNNLVWSQQSHHDDSSLWTIDKVANNQFIIRNKKDPMMVWTVQNHAPHLGTPINLEKLKAGSQREAQIFILTH